MTDVGIGLGAAALAATGVGLVADAGIAAGVGAGAGLASGVTDVVGIGAAEGVADPAVGTGAITQAANGLNLASMAAGEIGTWETCRGEGFTPDCAAGIALGVGRAVTGGGACAAGDQFPGLFWGFNGLGLAYNLAGLRHFGCG